jgi:Ca2+-binding RTX toxin-like protein
MAVVLQRWKRLEELVGRDYINNAGKNYVQGPNAAKILEAEYSRFKSYFSAQLESQVEYQDVFENISANYDAESGTFSLDIAPIWKYLELIYELGERIEYIDGALQTLRGLTKYSTSLQGQLETLKAESSLTFFMADRVLVGDDSDNELESMEGCTYIDGGAGNDTLTVYGLTSNMLLGGDGNDVLQVTDRTSSSGRSYSQTFEGGRGDDTMIGGYSNDLYIYNLGDGHDVINDVGYANNSSYQDTLRFGEGIAAEDLWLSRVDDDLQINVVGSDGQILIGDWFAKSTNQIESIETKGEVLVNLKVDLLVTAMAAYDVPNGAGAVIPEHVKEELQPTLAETWQ